MMKRAKAIQPLEREAMAKPMKRVETRREGMVAKTKVAVMVWRQRRKIAIAFCSLLLTFLPAFPNVVIVKASPRTPCTRWARVTSDRNRLSREG